jgi:OOP family OmpA-OmpF porin
MLRRSALILALLLAPGMTACATLQKLGLPGAGQSQFTRTLDIEYNNLADYEDQQQGNEKIAAYFRHKADRARSGGMPLPDDPNSIVVPEDAKQDIDDAYLSLIHALQAGVWSDNGALAAMAQTRFDCWLAIQVMESKPGAGEGCRDKFEEAMALLQPGDNGVKPDATSFTVYFKEDGIEIDDDGMNQVAKAAAALQAHDGWVVMLDGYTDPGEKGELARNLSIRRSMAVRNALAQQGVGMDDVMVGRFGRAPEGKAGDAGHERRVEMRIMPRDQADGLKSEKAEETLPEHFGRKRPVF